MLEELGRGSFGVVHRAMHVWRGTSVSAKILPVGHNMHACMGSQMQFQGRLLYMHGYIYI